MGKLAAVLSTAKTATHFLAVGAAALAGFFLTPAGQAVLHQYPQLSVIVAGLGAIAGLYRSPK